MANQIPSFLSLYYCPYIFRLILKNKNEKMKNADEHTTTTPRKIPQQHPKMYYNNALNYTTTTK